MSWDRWTKEKIRELIENNPRAVTRGIVAIYNLQTQEEKLGRHAKVGNGLGFSQYDAGFLSSLAQQLIAGQTLSRKQFDAGRRAIKKYAGQLAKIANGEIQ